MRITPLETRFGIGRYRVGDAEVTLLIQDAAAHCDKCKSQLCAHARAMRDAITLSRKVPK